MPLLMGGVYALGASVLWMLLDARRLLVYAIVALVYGVLAQRWLPADLGVGVVLCAVGLTLIAGGAIALRRDPARAAGHGGSGVNPLGEAGGRAGPADPRAGAPDVDGAALRGEEADFLYLLRESGLTKGNLSSHLSKLEEGEVRSADPQRRMGHGAAGASPIPLHHSWVAGKDAGTRRHARGGESRDAASVRARRACWTARRRTRRSAWRMRPSPPGAGPASASVRGSSTGCARPSSTRPTRSPRSSSASRASRRPRRTRSRSCPRSKRSGTCRSTPRSCSVTRCSRASSSCSPTRRRGSSTSRSASCSRSRPGTTPGACACRSWPPR